ncbi:hypothetical protein NAI67_10435, partial [Francisella tularensis subsp. holarctica]|nr:hypothetical protein [Francisella tularensis subsp. holarctica]
EFSIVYLMNQAMDKFIQSNGEADFSQLQSGNILAAMVLIIMVATIFVYAMIIIIQGIKIKHDLKVSDALKKSLQIFSNRVFEFLGE